MALYDSSQLLNIVNQANAHFTQLYSGGYNTNSLNLSLNMNCFGSSYGTGNPFGGFNNVSLLKPYTGSTTNFSGTTSSTKLSLGNLPGSPNVSQWRSFGYDATAGARLAQVARNNSVGFTGRCARYVKDAISDAGLGSWVPGHAFQMDDILRRNDNFIEISASTDVKSLPAGCVLVFNKGSRGYSSQYGHTEITDGKGHGISDGITRNLRQPDAIFMPVAA